MTSFVYDNGIVHFGIGEVNWTLGQTDIYATLLTAQPTKTWAHYSDLTGQVAAGGGYTTGGMVFPSLVTAVMVSTVCQYDGGDCAFSGATFSAAFASVNHGTLAGATNANLSAHDLGGTQTVTAGTLTLVWGGTGVFTITVAAAS